jgi:Protein of unknown function (DUF4236)
MGWRFRHSFKVIPVVKLNLSKSGLSCSVGGAPFTVNVGQRGIYSTASLPGTGISFRQRGDGSPTGVPATCTVTVMGTGTRPFLTAVNEAAKWQNSL